MSLPPSFQKPNDYFQESLSFFKKYQYLFNYANTDILVKGVLDIIDAENLEAAEVFRDDFDLTAKGCVNEFLEEFFEDLNKFRVLYKDFEQDLVLENKIDVPLSPKKKHEIAYLAKELKDMCEKRDCDVVVDFGSGLGYLDQLIFETTKLKVLGIECNDSHYVAAKKRQRKYHESSIENVKYIKHTITEQSDGNIQEFIKEKFGKTNGFCITGLHACADLTVDAINLFLKIEDAKALMIMPCCYHKMAEGCLKSNFKNFPLSKCLKTIFEDNKGHEYMNVPFLRLAAQPPSQNNDKLEDLVFNLLARATLEVYAYKFNCKLKRNKRKAVRMKTINNDFAKYIQDAVKGFTITYKDESLDKEVQEKCFDLEALHTIWREKESLRLKAAIFVLLQNRLQPMIENFILFDRIVYLKERGINTSCFKKIFDEKVSPRCLALVSIK